MGIAGLAALGGGLIGQLLSTNEPKTIRDEVLVVSPRSLVVSVEPANAQILINGQKVASPTIELKEADLQDSLSVDITADGYEKWGQILRVGPGVQHELEQFET